MKKTLLYISAIALCILLVMTTVSCSIDFLPDIFNQKDNEKTHDYPYTGEEWVEKNDANHTKDDFVEDIVITEIYSDCFFAQTVYPLPYQIKINGSLSKEWCVGDQVTCTCKNTYYDKKTDHVEADMIDIKESDLQLDPGGVYKPVIYLYPEKETEVSVKLDLNGTLQCTYPAYNNGWHVTASPDGTLTDGTGITYNYLYWEGRLNSDNDFSKGFCVKGSDTAAFLEDSLEKLGLTRREANEFIVFWLPHMQNNPYNIISFQTTSYTDAAKLKVSPQPDTMIRVYMAWYPSEATVSIPSQELTAPERKGFTVVEWGGTYVKR